MDDFIEKFVQGIAILILFIVVAAGMGILLAFPIKWTWNATMPYIFALPTITWGKAWCLSFLSGCLIKSTYSSSK